MFTGLCKGITPTSCYDNQYFAARYWVMSGYYDYIFCCLVHKRLKSVFSY